MKLIHVYRDIRDVVASYTVKNWASTNIELNLKWISDVFKKWEVIKQEIPQNTFYELSFENLIGNFEKTVRELCEFLNIHFHESMLDIDISRHNIGRWKKELKKENVQYINDNYSGLLIKYGYEVN